MSFRSIVTHNNLTESKMGIIEEMNKSHNMHDDLDENYTHLHSNLASALNITPDGLRDILEFIHTRDLIPKLEEHKV